MKFSFFLATLLIPGALAMAASGAEMVIAPPQMNFRFLQQEGEVVYSCTHKAANASGYDWDVLCGDGHGVVRNFGVHLLVNAYTSPDATKMKYEILYLVTAREIPMGHGRYVGSTTWVNLNQTAALESVDVSQDVEEIWSLELNLKLTPNFRPINPLAPRRTLR